MVAGVEHAIVVSTGAPVGALPAPLDGLLDGREGREVERHDADLLVAGRVHDLLLRSGTRRVRQQRCNANGRVGGRKRRRRRKKKVVAAE